MTHAACYTFDQEALETQGLALYYFAPANRAPGPYLDRRHVEAIIDISSDGRLAGVELIDNMPLPPVASKTIEVAAALPDLSHVISWLENGCDPKKAADELRIHQARIASGLSKNDAEPSNV